MKPIVESVSQLAPSITQWCTNVQSREVCGKRATYSAHIVIPNGPTVVIRYFCAACKPYAEHTSIERGVSDRINAAKARLARKIDEVFQNAE